MGKTPIEMPQNARHLAMANLFLSGKTLEFIGNIFSISRERVRQILKKYNITGKDGGRSLVEKIKKEAHDAAIKSPYNCTRERWRHYRAIANNYTTPPLDAYRRQYENAKRRGIDWEISMDEWWAIWEKSGGYARRGRKANSFVMARYGDQGPYSKDNVYIAAHSENIRSYIYNDYPIKEPEEAT